MKLQTNQFIKYDLETICSSIYGFGLYIYIHWFRLCHSSSLNFHCQRGPSHPSKNILRHHSTYFLDPMLLSVCLFICLTCIHVLRSLFYFHFFLNRKFRKRNQKCVRAIERASERKRTFTHVCSKVHDSARSLIQKFNDAVRCWMNAESFASFWAVIVLALINLYEIVTKPKTTWSNDEFV